MIDLRACYEALIAKKKKKNGQVGEEKKRSQGGSGCVFSDSYPALPIFPIYDGEESLYRQYKDFPSASSLTEIISEMLIQQ